MVFFLRTANDAELYTKRNFSIAFVLVIAPVLTGTSFPASISLAMIVPGPSQTTDAFEFNHFAGCEVGD